MVRQEMWSCTTCFGKWSIYYAYKISTLWLYCSYLCTYQYIIPKVKQPIILKFRSIQCMDMLLGEPQHLRMNYFAVANTENCKVKIKSKFVKVKILSF